MQGFSVVQQALFSDRVEIYNPGTFPLGYTPQDFIDGKGSSVKRNPLLAKLMYYVKDIENFGTGLKRIADACDSAGVKVEFKMLKLGFIVTFYRPDASVTDNATGNTIGEGNGAYIHVSNGASVGVNVGANGTNVGVNVGANVGVNETQQRILDLLVENPNFLKF